MTPVKEEILEDGEEEPVVDDSLFSHQCDRLVGYPIKSPAEFISDLIECNKAVCCNCDGSMACCEPSTLEENVISEDSDRHCSIHCSARKNDKNVEVAEQDTLDQSVTDDTTIENLCQTIHINEIQTLPMLLRTTVNSGGWLWVAGIEGKKENSLIDDCGDEILCPMKTALQSLQS